MDSLLHAISDLAADTNGSRWVLFAVLGLCAAGFAWIGYHLMVGQHRPRRRRRKHREML